MKTVFILTIALSGAMLSSLAAQRTLPERLRELPVGEDLDIAITPMHPTMDVAALLTASALVVEGVIASKASALTKDEHTVATTYDVLLDYVLRAPLSQTPAPEGALLTVVRVRHPGGEAMVGGHRVRVTDQSLPPFSNGTRLILFLERDPLDNQVFRIVNGPYGAFIVEGGRVRSITRDEAITTLYDDMDEATFRSLVQQFPQAR